LPTRADLVAFIKTFSERWEKEKPGDAIKVPAEPPVTLGSIFHGKAQRPGLVSPRHILRFPGTVA